MIVVDILRAAQSIMQLRLAELAFGNTLLAMREARGELEQWEMCTCVEGGDPPWHLHACPRDAGEHAAYGFRRVQP